MTLYPIYILVCIVIVLHVLASIYIATRQNLEQFQIVGKIVSIWFIPFLVSISIDLLYKNQGKSSRAAGNANNYRGNPITHYESRVIQMLNSIK